MAPSALRRAGVVAAVLSAVSVLGACAGLTSADVQSGDTPPDGQAGAVTGGGSTTTAPGSSAAPTTTTPETGPGPDHSGSGKAVTFAFGGDIHFEGGIATALARDPGSILAGVPVLAQADVAVVNVETAIATGGTKAPKQFAFRAPPAALSALAQGGADVMSLANNHGMDFGVAGLEETLAARESTGTRVIGIGRDEDEAYRPAVLEVKGQRIAVIAATQVLDGNLAAAWNATADSPGLASAKRVDRLVQAVREARSEADTLVVFLHWGTEKATCPNQPQRDLAPVLVEAGADVVVGSHAHRLLGGGWMGRSYVHYGLGNFVFYSGGKGAAAETGVLTLTATGRRIQDPVWHPARIGGDDLPRQLSGQAASDALAKWERLRACTGLSATQEAP